MTNYYNAPYARLGQQQQQQGGAGAPPPAAPPKVAPVASESYGAPARADSVEMPQLGATFVPGGFDDYYMPEVVAPAPQRVMPEVPQNMQEGLNRMELEAREIDPRRDSEPISPASVAQARQGREPSLSSVLANNGPSVSAFQPQMSQQPPPVPFKPSQEAAAVKADTMLTDLPSFSPFPKVKGENVPPSDEEKEEILWSARQHVLHSNNVNMQLSWARDTLSWVEIIMEATVRELNGSPRPPTPKVEHELRMDALNIVNYLATQEHPEALFMRGKFLEFGKFGYRVDKKEAYQGYAKAASMGFGRAEYRMGMLYENSNEFTKAIEHYNRGLKLKDSAASYRLGMMYLLGQHGHKKDFQHGLDLIQAAADTADEDAPQGAYVYGMLIARDLPDINIPEGILPYNLQVARMYIEKAAYLGFAKAQLKMGQAFELAHLGCDFNPAYSLHYYGLAAKQAIPEASLGVSRWFLFGYEGIFNKNEPLAFQYAQQAAAAKLPTGEFAMGYYYEIGIHVDKDLREARNWYEKAAEHGNKDAVGRLESLNQSKTLTKADHETTTLTRIKSQHGSQRGKRPERFKQTSAMPTLAETEPATPVKDEPALPPKLTKAATPSPKQSPQPSPRSNPTVVQEEAVQFPDPSQLSLQNNRVPAFTLNIDTQNLAPRPKSTAPYPEDDRPPPLNVSRPKSTAPYPEDDMKAPLSPHYKPNIRPSAGPQADRPMSAFGIRPLNTPSSRDPSPIRQSQSMATLVPPAGSDPRRRVVSAGWEPQVPAGYRQPGTPGSAGPGRGDYRRDDYGPGPGPQGPQRPATTQPYSAGPVPNNPAHNRLTKTNPYDRPQERPPQFPMNSQGPQGPGPRDSYGQSPMSAQPGRDYGPRTSSRPVSGDGRPMSAGYDSYNRTGTAPPASFGGGAGGRPDRFDSLPSQQKPPSAHQSLPSQSGRNSLPSQQSGHRPVQLSDRPTPADHHRVDSAPPSSKPASRPPQRPSPGPTHAATQPPPPKPSGQGPSTFEEMGIPQGKNDSDCVVM